MANHFVISNLLVSAPWMCCTLSQRFSRRCSKHADMVADVTVVTVSDLRNHGGEVLERVERGETMVVTRDGRPSPNCGRFGGPVLILAN
jgi:hypothetical protein